MKLRTAKILMTIVLVLCSSIRAQAQFVQTNPLEWLALAEGNEAITNNPQGIVATMNMNNLYIETATELVSVYTLLRNAVATGGPQNMLTGAERSETLWALSDRLDAFSKKLHQLYLSIRYYTMTDVWNNVTAGMIDRDNSEIAHAALNRWRRAARAINN